MSSGSKVSEVPPEITRWFATQGWELRRHQQKAIRAADEGQHMLLVADTGSGKTLAGFLPTLADFTPSRQRAQLQPDGLHTLYVSPLKALSNDVARNLLKPVEEMGLPIRVETRSGDTSNERKRRQRTQPPHILLTTPESLSLMLSYPDSEQTFGGLKRIVIDEVHSFANSKRGDLLALCLSRLQSISPSLRRSALSATIADPHEYRAWLANSGERDSVMLVEGEDGAPPLIEILLPNDQTIPWGGHAGVWAIPQLYEEIKRNKTTLVFTNTRYLAELTFKMLWDANENKLPIGIHHGSLGEEARQKVENAMANGKLRALVCTASLDLGIDWGDIDCVVQMGAPKGSSRLLQRIGRANHRLDTPSRALLVPGNRFEFLEAVAAKDAIDQGQRDDDYFRRGSLDVLAQHVMGCACSRSFQEEGFFQEVVSAYPFRDLKYQDWERVLNFVANGGYSLKAYEKFKRISRSSDGVWSLVNPKHAQRHRMNAGIIIEGGMMTVRFKNGRKLGKVEERFAATLSPSDTFFFAGLDLQVHQIMGEDIFVYPAKGSAVIPSYGGARMPLTTHLSMRVRSLLNDRLGWARFPDDVREWLEVQDWRSALPTPSTLLVESFPHHRKQYTVYHTFEGWNANQSLGMLITKRMENLAMSPGGFVANDYSLAVWGLEPVSRPELLLSPEILENEFVEWVQESHLLRRAFREVSIISGLVERQHFGTRKTGKQVTFSTDLIYDVLRKYEPHHLLLEAAWEDAKLRLTDIERLAGMLERSKSELHHVELSRVSPLAVPIMTMIGRESVPPGEIDDQLLLEAESLAAESMQTK